MPKNQVFGQPVGGGIISRLIIGYMTETLLGRQFGVGVFYAYNSVLFFPASVCFFLAFNYLNIKNKIIEKVSLSLGSVCFGVYLLTDHPLIRDSLWKTLNLSNLYDYGIWTLLNKIIITVAALFIIGCLIEKARVIVFRILQIERMYRYLDTKFAQADLKLKTTLEEYIGGR